MKRALSDIQKPAGPAVFAPKAVTKDRAGILTQAIIKGAEEKSIALSEIGNFESVDFSGDLRADELRGEGQTVMFVAVDGSRAGSPRRNPADITLLKGDLRGILRAKKSGEATMKNIRQNLFFAFVHQIGGGPSAACVPYPVFGLPLSPMIASAAMTFGSVSVIVNALRLGEIKS